MNWPENRPDDDRYARQRAHYLATDEPGHTHEREYSFVTQRHASTHTGQFEDHTNSVSIQEHFECRHSVMERERCRELNFLFLNIENSLSIIWIFFIWNIDGNINLSILAWMGRVGTLLWRMSRKRQPRRFPPERPKMFSWRSCWNRGMLWGRWIWNWAMQWWCWMP